MVDPLKTKPSRERITVENTRQEMVAAIAGKIGLNEAIANPIADAVLDALREHFAGRLLWIPAKSREERDEAIRREFNGRNKSEVMKKYDLSRAQFYRIIGKPMAKEATTEPLGGR